MSNDIDLIQLDIATALERAKTFKVTDNDTRLKASESRKQVRQWEKAVEESYKDQKEELYRPYKALLDEIKSLNDILKTLDGIFKKGIEDFDREQETIRRKAAEAENQRLLALQKEQEKALAEGKTVEAVPAIQTTYTSPPPAPKAEGEYAVEVWEFEITDKALIPDEFKIIDEAKIKATAKTMKGLANIPGVRVYSRQDIRQRA